ncbi:MAG TPA: Rrf2 family transcriptional regulator [Terriglobia bacterium]|nr:Rrf2 family transcriptional regulator [Terriglobia bacterium]
MLLSRPCTYAVRALIYLAMQPPGKLTGSREIAVHEDIPNSFLCKILLELRRKRLLRSYKGIGGGYELALPPDKINLLTIVQSIEGELAFTKCILEDHQCSDHCPCALHESWVELQTRFIRFFETQTLAVLVATRQAQEGKPSDVHRQLPAWADDQSNHLSIKPPT